MMVMKKNQNPFVRYCLMSKGVSFFFITKTIAAVLPRGSKKRESNNEDKHGHGQEKRRLPTYGEGQNDKLVRLCGPHHIQNYTNKQEIVNFRKSILMFWGLFNQLRGCNVSVAASGVFLFWAHQLFSCPERPGESQTSVLEKKRKGNVFWCF